MADRSRWGGERGRGAYGGDDRLRRGLGDHGGRADQDPRTFGGYGGGYAGASSDYGGPVYGRDERARARPGAGSYGRPAYADEDDMGRDRDRSWTDGDQRGRGPKGYARSDERILEDACDRLTDDPWLDASQIEVMVQTCEVVLTGAVESREDKHRAEDLVETVSGVRHVQNNLRIQPGGDGSASHGRT